MSSIGAPLGMDDSPVASYDHNYTATATGTFSGDYRNLMALYDVRVAGGITSDALAMTFATCSANRTFIAFL